MAFHADEYIGVIVEQIGENFTALDVAVKTCPDLDKAIKKYRDLQNRGEDDFFTLKDSTDKIEAYQQSIGDLVCTKYRTVEPLSVGLFGEWGSGKTHLLKLIESRINQLQVNPLKDEKDIFPQITIPIFFNAWRFEKEEHLIVPLFSTMLAQLEAYEHFSFKDKAKRFSKTTWKKLKILSKALKKGLKIPNDLEEIALSEVLDGKSIADAYKKEAKQEFEYTQLLQELTQTERLESIYYEIPKWIEKIAIFDNISFVFLIDDLDRCLPENTLKMLESIKLFLDVPSCAFVLAIDDDVVERGVAYHYRDYLQQNNNIIINLEKEEVEKEKAQTQELPITGHEYLEKMIQLPFRIPVIGTDNVLEFLESNYKDRFEKLLEDEEREQIEQHLNSREFGELKQQISKTDEILKFFSKTIPPKPRKIKRTAMLFETKVRLLKSLELERRDRLIAKITLLELFAPKLLRFMQNNNYERIYNRLVHFRGIESTKEEKSDEKTTLSLADVDAIKAHINSKEAKYTTKERELFIKLMNIVTESRNSRMVFDLDAIFDKSESEENLKLNIEMAKTKRKEKIKEKLTNLSETSLAKLFRPNDVASWSDAFKDNRLLEEGEALLSDTELDTIITKAKRNLEFAKDPEWVGMVAKYVNDEQYTHLLKELYEYRFVDINGKFKMGIYQVTFAEYDRYCQVKGLKKSKDREWGRGKRPIIYVSWEEVTIYAKWLSEVLEVNYKLPSSDDWLLACNNGKTTKWHFGDEEKELKEYTWYRDNSDGKTHPVGEKKPNYFGLYDMHGNVWEWCEDWHDEEKKSKILRGGSWLDYSDVSRSANRDRYTPSNRYFIVGFRLLRTLP